MIAKLITHISYYTVYLLDYAVCRVTRHVQGQHWMGSFPLKTITEANGKQTDQSVALSNSDFSCCPSHTHAYTKLAGTRTCDVMLNLNSTEPVPDLYLKGM